MEMKKRLGLSLLLILCLLLTACTSSTPEAQTKSTGNLDPKNPVVVTLWHYYVGENQQALESAVSSFNQTVGIENGVVVDPVAMGSIAELETEISKSAQGIINSSPMPQLFSSYPDKALEIDSHGMVADLNEYFTEEEKSQYVADFLADGTFDGGRMLVLPIVKSTELLYLNASTWNEFAQAEGIDASSLETWESLYETAKAYYNWTATPEKPWSGKGMMGFDSVANYIIAGSKQMGLEVIDATAGEAGAAVLKEDVLRRIFDIYYKATSLGYFDSVGKFRSDDIKAGDLIAYVGSSSSAAYFPTWIEESGAQKPIDFLPVTYPVFDGGTSYAIQQGAGMCVAKSTPAQQEGAVLFLKWFTAPEENIRFAMTTGYLPVQTAAYSSEAFQTALDTQRAGDHAQQNVAGVYDISLRQITELNTYTAKPFDGSYDVRSILQSSLIDAGLAGRELAAPMKAENKTEAEILEALDVDAAFAAWMNTVRARLDEGEIEYSL